MNSENIDLNPLIIYIILILIIRFYSMSQRKSRQSTSRQLKDILNEPTAIIMVINAVVAFSTPVLEAALKNFTVILILQIVGGLIILSSGSIAYFANREIAENWSPVITKSEEQNVVTSGIYKHIRHPLYLAGLMIVTGTNLYFSNTWSWITGALALAAVLYRIPFEEKKLVEKFGKEYSDYIKDSWALVPHIF